MSKIMKNWFKKIKEENIKNKLKVRGWRSMPFLDLIFDEIQLFIEMFFWFKKINDVILY